MNIYSGTLGAALLAVALLPAAGGLAGAVPRSLTVTEQGVPKAVIVKPAGASQVIDFAAAELREYVRRISGATLPVSEGGEKSAGPGIVLGTAKLDPPRQGLPCDSFTVETKGERLLLTGNTDRAVLYAVYAFLESLGAAWLEPGETGEFLPHLPTILVPKLALASKPGFDLRGLVLYDQGGGKEAVDWMGKMRMNLIMHASNAQECERRGILVMEGTMHGIDTRMGWAPGWEKEPANYKYLAMVNGKREPLYKDKPWDSEPCLSNGEAVEKLISASVTFMETNRPGVYIFDARADDRPNTWCECEACCRQTATDNHVAYVNTLAKVIHEKWPERKVSLIAYYDTMSPPKAVMPDLSMNNMVLWFAPITRPYSQPVFSATAEKTTMDYPRNKEKWPVTDGAWQPFLRAWRDAFKGPILVLDYYHWSLNAKGRSSYFYMCPEVIAADLRFYKESGVSGSIGVEPCPLKLPNGWNNYLKAKLLWNPSQDVAELQRSFEQSFYGNCTGAAGKCLASITDTLKAGRDDAESVRKVKEAAAAFIAETAACPKTPAVGERLDRISLWAAYAALRKEYFRYKEPGSARKKAADDVNGFLTANQAKIARYYTNVESMRVTP